MGALRNQDLSCIVMLLYFSLENPLFSLEPSSIIAIGHSTHLLREYTLLFFTIFHFSSIV
jgi:hypothetical protein